MPGLLRICSRSPSWFRRGSSSVAALEPHLGSAEWLHSSLRAKQPITVLDASYYLPAPNRRAAYDEFIQAHIPGARFFDIDAISDTTSSLPHMLPPLELFTRAAASLGISRSTPVVVYDCSTYTGVCKPGQGGGLFSAARVWWTLRYFGHSNVRVLDGGLAAWAAAGFALESGAPTDSRVPPDAWRPVPSLLARMADVQQLSASLAAVAHTTSTAAIVDARSMPRFEGSAPEPRPGILSGHMPAARCIPFAGVMDPARPGHLRSVPELEALFSAAGVPASAVDARIVASCGSGVTACVLAHAVARVRAQRGVDGSAGLRNVSVYDGAWAEWASNGMNPIVKGPPT